MRLASFLFFIAALLPSFAQPSQAPNVEAQRAAMKKLDFLIGKWFGVVRVQSSASEVIELSQTEDAQYKLDSLALQVEGTARNKSDGKTVSRALATVSYDDATGTYWMRAYNDGRYLETSKPATC